MRAIDFLGLCCLATFVAFSGIYWVPGVPPNFVSLGKAVIFSGLVVIALLSKRVTSKKERNVTIYLFLASLAVFAAVYWTEGGRSAVGEARNFLEPAAWLLALSAVPFAYRTKLFDIMTISMMAFFAVTLYPIMAVVGVLPDTQTPASFFGSDASQWLIDSSTISSSGFSGSRTGWGATVATGGLLALVLLMRRKNISVGTKYAAALIIALSIVSIAVTGARGGLLAFICALGYWYLSDQRRFLASFILLFFVVTLTLTVDIQSLIPENLLRGFGGGGSASDRINSITTGRFDTYLKAINSFSDSPIFGVGPAGSKILVRGEMVQVHNLWLRVAVESGLMAIVFLCLITSELMSLVLSRRTNKNGVSPGLNSKNMLWPNARPVIVCGLVLALGEPNIIIGAFNANAVFWTAVWIVMCEPKTKSMHFKNRFRRSEAESVTGARSEVARFV